MEGGEGWKRSISKKLESRNHAEWYCFKDLISSRKCFPLQLAALRNTARLLWIRQVYGCHFSICTLRGWFQGFRSRLNQSILEGKIRIPLSLSERELKTVTTGGWGRFGLWYCDLHAVHFHSASLPVPRTGLWSCHYLGRHFCSTAHLHGLTLGVAPQKISTIEHDVQIIWKVVPRSWKYSHIQNW